MSIVEFKNVTRIYKSGDHEQKALDNVSLTLEEGKFIVILGPSGAGKSTLLNMLGGLDSPTNGTIKVNGKDISTLSQNELADYRASTVGFVFQFYNLIPTLCGSVVARGIRRPSRKRHYHDDDGRGDGYRRYFTHRSHTHPGRYDDG